MDRNGLRVLLLVVAVIVFALGTFSVPAPVDLTDLGLALGFGAFIVPRVTA